MRLEIYSGYVLNKWLDGTFTEDRNAWLVDYWDDKLTSNPRLFAVAVNDWYGSFADSRFTPETKWAQDTGKQILLTPEKTSAAAKEAFRTGAMFALIDQGDIKGGYPNILSIDVGDSFVRVNTDANVRWISGGEQIANGPYIELSLVGNRNYLRAEISNESSVIYTQPWEIGHCDFNINGTCDIADVDMLTAAGDLLSGVPVVPGTNGHLELTDDGLIDQQDLDTWLAEAGLAQRF